MTAPTAASASPSGARPRGSRTLVPVDRPDALAAALRGFLADTGALPAAAAS